MKKIVSLFLAISMLLTLALRTVIAEDINFSDLIANGTRHWAYDTVMEAANRNIINGYTDGTFRPNNNVEVDAYIKMVVAAMGNNLQNGNDYWASTYINKAIELKLIEGNEYNTYRRAITREEAAKIIVNALAVNEQLPDEQIISKIAAKVPDYNKISDKYKQHVLIAYTTGLITGDTKGYFKPQSNLTRAEAATVIMRLLDKDLRQPILTDDEVSTELPELLKSDEEVWGREDIAGLTPYGQYLYYTVKHGKMLFNVPPDLMNYELSEKLNPDINDQVYKATKVLMDDNHYVDVRYANFDNTRAFVGFTKSSAFASNYNYLFQFIFFEKEPFNAKQDWQEEKFSDKSFLMLSLYSLWWDFDKNSWSTSFYETKLKHSLMAIFGEAEGKQVYDYVYTIYIDKRTHPEKYVNKNLTKTFTTVKVDFPNDDSSTLDFLFSKVGD